MGYNFIEIIYFLIYGIVTLFVSIHCIINDFTNDITESYHPDVYSPKYHLLINTYLPNVIGNMLIMLGLGFLFAFTHYIFACVYIANMLILNNYLDIKTAVKHVTHIQEPNSNL